MKSYRSVWFGAFLATGAAVAVIGGNIENRDAFAGQPAVQAEPTVASLATQQDGFKWGMTHAEVIKIHNQVNGIFDRDYNPILAKMQPGVRMDAVEKERDALKTAFQNNFLQFKDTPTGYDTTALRGEYSYRNKESVQLVTRAGKRRFFFYIGDTPGERLWKIYDEVKLVDGGPLGKSFAEANQKLTVQVGAPGAVRGADEAKGFPLPYLGWQDAASHLRLIDRSGEGIAAVVVEDKQVLSALPQLRSAKSEDLFAMDPALAAATRGGLSDPNARVDAGAPAPTKKKK